MKTEPTTHDWVALCEEAIPIAKATEWAIDAGCGALVTFLGTVRDHSEGRTGVLHLDYEAYPEQVEPRLVRAAQSARQRWPVIGKVALLHRVGRLFVGETSVFVAVSTPSRPEAFLAGKYLIDTVKATVPIWKKETWASGSDWAVCEHVVTNATGDEQDFELVAERYGEPRAAAGS